MSSYALFCLCSSSFYSPLSTLADHVSGRITSIILEDDFACRCSLSSVHRLLLRLSRLDGLALSLSDRVGIVRRVDRSLLLSLQEDSPPLTVSSADLYVPGKLVWVQSFYG
jgi:hypothetical protein